MDADHKRVVASASSIVEGTTHVVEVDGSKVLLTRVGGVVRASSAWCTHARALLGPFPIVDENLIECPLHGAIFSAIDGERIDGPTCAPLRVVEAVVDEDGMVVVDMSSIASDPVPAAPATTSWGAWGLDASSLT